MSTAPHRRAALAVLVAAGGLVGTFARHGLDVLFPDDPGQWPVTTFVVNITGAFLLGMLLEALTRYRRGAPGGPSADGRWPTYVRLGVGTGMLGAFTTYSTLAVDTDLLLHRGSAGSAVSYALATVLVGAVACALGIAAGARLGQRVGGPPAAAPGRDRS
ncbi:fluoride efflux transporter FluC [Tomitella cavernea]|uniref:Fluoride-specific ion channel FluC n=1 Tax=Tomitella cavernea TaxID=1387982 RepID=A0ABP9CBC5_9ACTN|nr:CrcB family protein [Tomitella cavernea]